MTWTQTPSLSNFVAEVSTRCAEVQLRMCASEGCLEPAAEHTAAAHTHRIIFMTTRYLARRITTSEGHTHTPMGHAWGEFKYRTPPQGLHQYRISCLKAAKQKTIAQNVTMLQAVLIVSSFSFKSPLREGNFSCVINACTLGLILLILVSSSRNSST